MFPESRVFQNGEPDYSPSHWGAEQYKELMRTLVMLDPTLAEIRESITMLTPQQTDLAVGFASDILAGVRLLKPYDLNSKEMLAYNPYALCELTVELVKGIPDRVVETALVLRNDLGPLSCMEILAASRRLSE